MTDQTGERRRERARALRAGYLRVAGTDRRPDVRRHERERRRTVATIDPQLAGCALESTGLAWWLRKVPPADGSGGAAGRCASKRALRSEYRCKRNTSVFWRRIPKSISRLFSFWHQRFPRLPVCGTMLLSVLSAALYATSAAWNPPTAAPTGLPGLMIKPEDQSLLSPAVQDCQVCSAARSSSRVYAAVACLLLQLF